jgi:hypothetical protein
MIKEKGGKTIKEVMEEPRAMFFEEKDQGEPLKACTRLELDARHESGD